MVPAVEDYGPAVGSAFEVLRHFVSDCSVLLKWIARSSVANPALVLHLRIAVAVRSCSIGLAETVVLAVKIGVAGLVKHLRYSKSHIQCFVILEMGYFRFEVLGGRVETHWS